MLIGVLGGSKWRLGKEGDGSVDRRRGEMLGMSQLGGGECALCGSSVCVERGVSGEEHVALVVR
jgi:hypothetical protein